MATPRSSGPQRDAVGSEIARTTIEIRVRGIVQGVGFRPFVYRLARARNLCGEVLNDGDELCIRVAGDEPTIREFVDALAAAPPPLARIDRIEQTSFNGRLGDDFRIVPSAAGEARRGSSAISPDAATCPVCRAEIFDPSDRRYRYPFTNCTHCGPRLSIVWALPYDRHKTSMAKFAMCPECSREYHDPTDRRFHAQPNACPVCGPRARLEQPAGAPVSLTEDGDVMAATWALLQQGAIVAVKGVGGYQLACLATAEPVVARLRRRKHRYGKPFALMARDISVIRRYCRVSQIEQKLLESPKSPIVIMLADGPESVAPSVAPRQKTLGFMLPNTPLHHLLLEKAGRPIVLTSGNRSDEPQCIGDDEARENLGGIADFFLTHDREIVNRVDDSVVRVVGRKPRQLRRARGYAPAPIALPPGFEKAPEVLALGAQLKATFCMVRDGQAVLSQHMGDLQNAAAYTAYRHTLDLYLQLLDRSPEVLAIDLHPEMLSAKLGEELAGAGNLELVRVQHHHAHAAACMAENGVPLNDPPVLAIVLDGLGYGSDGSLWGGEFLLADYTGYRRLATFRPTPMPGGEQAIREPWRMAFAYLSDAFEWKELAEQCRALGFFERLETRPLSVLSQMIETAINCPTTTACGRLFDAVSAVAGVCSEVTYEGQAAIELEATAPSDPARLADEEPAAYRLRISGHDRGDLAVLDPRPMWGSLLEDLRQGASTGTVSARFHLGLVKALVDMVLYLEAFHGNPWQRRVALSGGVFQNALLLEEVTIRLQAAGIRVLSHVHVPCNDGGLSLGQAAVAAAQVIGRST